MEHPIYMKRSSINAGSIVDGVRDCRKATSRKPKVRGHGHLGLFGRNPVLTGPFSLLFTAKYAHQDCLRDYGFCRSLLQNYSVFVKGGYL
jgi:hypothetical protein